MAAWKNTCALLTVLALTVFIQNTQVSDLVSQMMAEVRPCVSEYGEIDTKDLGEHPILQSIHAEVFRLCIEIIVSQVVESQDITFDGYTLQRRETS
ncbi:hypothetical protein F4818DRAFT_418916 [Hypoxylon cercidicola]|nr:hypothetical protein F4818DRAFT_418916 [Hypoxylon cercidicola]